MLIAGFALNEVLQLSHILLFFKFKHLYTNLIERSPKIYMAVYSKESTINLHCDLISAVRSATLFLYSGRN